MRERATHRLGIAAALLCAAVRTGATEAPRAAGARPADGGDARPSFLVVLTDDQRFDTLWAMPIVREKLVSRGVVFTNAIVTTPMCCPERASFLAGGFFAHDTGVLANQPPNGGVQAFADRDTIATALQRAGYATVLIGKYLNGYVRIAPYVPPGWTRFLASASNMNARTEWSRFAVVEGSSRDEPAEGRLIRAAGTYVTDWYQEAALRFLEKHEGGPFFLLFSTHAPHEPAVPAPGDERLFASYVHRGRAFGEGDRSDKPSFVHERPPPLLREVDDLARDQLRSLQAVDRTVGAMVEALERRGLLDRTVLVFTSDNGYLWGEHGLIGKGKPYEESLRVPLVVAAPGVAPRTDDHLVAANLDLAATILDLAGVPGRGDGKSLAPVLGDPGARWREEVLIEGYVLADGEPLIWAGLRGKRGPEAWKYVEYPTGEVELYDLATDPHEEDSQHCDEARTRALAARLGPMKGLAITVDTLHEGTAGVPFELALQAWGGRKPYAWSVAGGRLPAGLALDAGTGIVTGVPRRPEVRRVEVKVADASASRATGRPQAHVLELTFSIAARPGAKPPGAPEGLPRKPPS